MTDLQQALINLNNAAYAALRAEKYTTAYPTQLRLKLLMIARMTDELVETPNVD